jgi:signal transduction histidine kinase
MSALSPIGSIKVKLGLLVVVSAGVTGIVAAAGAGAGVPVWLTLPVTALVALAVTQLLAAGMVAPLRAMTGAAEAMARGDYSARVSTVNVDEVGHLAAAFNRMADDLARVDAERRDLIATVSHELRTPVAALSAQLENLADGVVEPSPESIAPVLDGAERLGGLLSDLLALSRTEAGVTTLDVREVGLAELVAECAAQVRESGRQSEVSVEVPASMRVRVDPARMRQLLTNVLDNACRHAPEGEPVVVLAGARTGDGWWLEVRDRGRGVPPGDRDRVFERFGTDASGGGGTGLGLAVSRWVARLHGGSLSFVDPLPGASGARLRLELPGDVPGARPAGGPVVVDAPRAPVPPVMPTPAPPLLGPEREPYGARPDALELARWPEARPEGDLRPVAGAALVGVLAGAVMTYAGPGLSWVVVLLCAGLCAWWASARRTDRFTLTCSLLAVALVSMMALRADAALAMLGVVVAAGVFLAGVTSARTFRGMLLAGVAWPASGLRGLPWLGRSLGRVGFRGRVPALLRTALVSVVAAGSFVLLFSAADVTFARWVDRLLPSWHVDDLVARGFVAAGVFGLTLTAAYLARNPAQVDPTDAQVTKAGHRWEWLVPVLLVDAVFAGFVLTQVRVVLHGHAWVQREAGLSYGEYVHQGFGQLVVATLLALLVVWAAHRHAGRDADDRRWLLGSLGVLCLLTLCVAAAALGRMWLYQDVYGFTTLRVVVIIFEIWVCLVVLSVAVLGLRAGTRHVARFALLSGAAAVLVLLLGNPDAWVAERNIDRYEATGRLDLAHLSQLSPDAAPVVLGRLSTPVASCVLEWSDWGPAPTAAESPQAASDGPGWSVGRARGERVAAEFVADHGPPPSAADCSALADRLGGQSVEADTP